MHSLSPAHAHTHTYTRSHIHSLSPPYVFPLKSRIKSCFPLCLGSVFVPDPQRLVPKACCLCGSRRTGGWRERRPHGDTLLLIHQPSALTGRKQGLCAVNTCRHNKQTEITRAQPSTGTVRVGCQAGLLVCMCGREIPWLHGVFLIHQAVVGEKKWYTVHQTDSVFIRPAFLQWMWQILLLNSLNMKRLGGYVCWGAIPPGQGVKIASSSKVDGYYPNTLFFSRWHETLAFTWDVQRGKLPGIYTTIVMLRHTGRLSLILSVQSWRVEVSWPPEEMLDHTRLPTRRVAFVVKGACLWRAGECRCTRKPPCRRSDSISDFCNSSRAELSGLYPQHLLLPLLHQREQLILLASHCMAKYVLNHSR